MHRFHACGPKGAQPGIVSAAYRQFHNYSIGNQLLAWSQCIQRGIRPGPLATFPKYKELGRYVRKGASDCALPAGDREANTATGRRNGRR